MITKIISHKLRSKSFIMLVAKANTFGHEFLRCFLVEMKKLIWMVSFEMESKTDLSNRKKAVPAQVTLQNVFQYDLV